MVKVQVPFGEWRPDIALLDNEFAFEAKNVFSAVNSYRPFPGLLRYATDALPDECVGLTVARNSTGEWKIYAGTATDLYRYTAAGWVEATRLVGGDYSVSPGDQWRFQQNGTRLYATHLNIDVMQRIDIDAGSNFADAPGTPPPARSIAQVGPFLVLAGLQANERKIRWSALENPEIWTVGTSLCDEQEMAEGGPVQGVAGGEIGYVVQDRAIRTMQWLPGDTERIFSFSRVLEDRGSVSKYGFLTVANVLYLFAEDGFYAMAGAQLLPIGANKIDDWFREHSDIDRWNQIQAVAFPHHPVIGWAYHMTSASQYYDGMMLYDFSHQKWTHTEQAALIWAATASLNLDLDTDGPEPNDANLDSTARSLDSFAYIGGRPLLSAIDPDGYLAALNGPNLAATMETVERHLVPGSRSFVNDAYPICDASGGLVSAGLRERLQDPVAWSNPEAIEITGSAPLFTSARLQRFRHFVPPGETWTHAQGVVVEAQQDGTVA